jgi:hypothetical protein
MKRFILLIAVATILITIKLLAFNDKDSCTLYNNPARPYVLGAP